MNRLLTWSLVCLLPLTAQAADSWPNWRGPSSNGVAPGKSYPTTWSTSQNMKWKVELPGPGASTPIVWNDRIYLTLGKEGKNSVLALDRSGKTAWQTTLDAERPGKHKKATGSNSSPTTDGQHVYAYFKSGTLAALDLSGKVVWEQNLQKLYGEDTLWWDLGTSPVLTQQHVVVAVMQTGPSYLAAFDKLTGKPAWKQDRNLDAPSEAAQSYSTPVVVDENGKQTLVVLGADHVTAHAAETGKELWRVGGLNPTGHQYFRSIASPVVANGIVVAPYARGATVTGIKLGGSGDVTKSHVVWTKQGAGTDVPTPVANGQRAYVCTDKGELTCLDVQTGKVLWSGQTEKNRFAFSASPILADGKVYLTREDGKVFVIADGSEFKVLAGNELDGETCVATPVFIDGQILIRTLNHLYCIGS